MRLSILSTMAEAPWGGSEELWAGAATAALEAGWQVQALLPHFAEPHPKRTALARAGVALSSWTADDIRRWNAATANPAVVTPADVLSPYRSLVDPRPDLLLISHGGLMDMVNGHGGMLSELWSSGVPYVVVIQANTEGYWPNDTQRAFMRNYFGGALQVIFVSRQNLEFARRQVADPFVNAVVWQQPVNLSSLRAVKWPKEPTLHLASVARLDVLSKGQDMLLEILSTPAWRARDWKLNFYGTGPSLPLLQESAALGGIGDRVKFHGQVPDVAQIWRDNHVLVMPSRVEGTPLALLEALCCGRPALATDVGGSADWLIAGQTGFIAEAPRTEQLAPALEQLWQNRSALPAMGEAAARFIAQSFHPRPGKSLLQYLEAQLNLRPKAATISPRQPLLSVVRVTSTQSPVPAQPKLDASLAADVEFITVFAGSTAAASADDEALRAIHEPLSNPAVAANTGLHAARGSHALVVENAQEISDSFLCAAIATLRQNGSPRFLCTQPPTADNAVPALGVFPLQAWRAAGGYPARVQADFQNWFWHRLRLRGEKIEALSAATATVVAPAAAASTVPRVTVVVTCYNYATYLERCIDSVLAQDFENFEIVIVNDGSTDTSPLVADWLAALHPGKIRVLHQANSGQPAISRNNGIRIARGELILPLDADDWIDPTMLRECVALLDADPTLGVAYTDSLYCHERGKAQLYPAGEFSVASLREANRLSCCSLYRKKIWTTVGGYRTNVRGYEDWDFWIAAAASGHTGRRIAKPLFFYRVKPSGVYFQTAAKDNLLRAQIRLNNPRCFTADERAQAKAYIARESQSKPAATLPPSADLNALLEDVKARYQAQDWAGCAQACARVVALSPEDCSAWIVYADSLAKQGKISEALAAIENPIRLQPTVEAHKHMKTNLLKSAKPSAPHDTPPPAEPPPPTTTPDDFARIVNDAEALVREGRLDDAIAKIEQTLNLSPTAECAARAREILELLRAEKSTPTATPPAAEAPATAEIFATEEVQNIHLLIAAYTDNPADPAREQLLALQQGLMNFLVTADATTLDGQFQGTFGEVYRALVKSGLPAEAATEESLAQLAILDDALAGAENLATPPDFRVVLARMLCAPADRGTLTVAAEKLPAWLRDDYATYLANAPRAFAAAGAAE